MPTYLAGKLLKIGDEFREVGSEVPEAAEWWNLDVWLHDGSVIEVPDPPVQPEVQPEVAPEVVPEVEAESAPEPEAEAAAEEPPAPPKASRSSRRGTQKSATNAKEASDG